MKEDSLLSKIMKNDDDDRYYHHQPNSLSLEWRARHLILRCVNAELWIVLDEKKKKKYAKREGQNPWVQIKSHFLQFNYTI